MFSFFNALFFASFFATMMSIGLLHIKEVKEFTKGFLTLMIVSGIVCLFLKATGAD